MSKQYQPMNLFKNESRNARTKNKNCYTMLGNVNWCCISTTKRIYYCECSILSRLLIAEELCTSSRPSILVQYWNNNSYCQEQELWNTVQIGTLD